MNAFDRFCHDSTSADGPMRPLASEVDFIVLRSNLTSANADTGPTIRQDLLRLANAPSTHDEEDRDFHPPISSPQSTASAINELRRLSGLTWEQIARIFKTSRRSLHFWASGKPMNAINEEHLRRVLLVVRQIDRGTAVANRSALLDGKTTDGIPIDLLAEGEFDQVVSQLGVSDGDQLRLAPLSDGAATKHVPPPPGELVDALHNRIAPASGRRISLDRLRKGRDM